MCGILGMLSGRRGSHDSVETIVRANPSYVASREEKLPIISQRMPHYGALSA